MNEDLLAWIEEMHAALKAGDQEQAQVALGEITRINRELGAADRATAQPQQIGSFTAGALGAAQGATAGFLPELAGGAAAVGAMLPGGRNPGQALQGTQQVVGDALQTARQQHPLASLAGDITGTALPAAAVTKAMAPLRLASPIGRGIALGAGVGALRGAGEGEGAGGRGIAALLGAGIGGLGGGVVGKGAQKLGQWLKRVPPPRAAPPTPGPMGLTAEDVAARNAQPAGRMVASPADLTAIEARRQAAIAARGAPPQASGNLALESGRVFPTPVIDEVMREVQQQGPQAASKILQRAAGAPPQGVTPIQQLLNQATETNPLTLSVEEQAQQLVAQLGKRRASEAASNAYNIAITAGKSPEEALIIARRAAAFTKGSSSF